MYIFIQYVTSVSISLDTVQSHHSHALNLQKFHSVSNYCSAVQYNKTPFHKSFRSKLLVSYESTCTWHDQTVGSRVTARAIYHQSCNNPQHWQQIRCQRLRLQRESLSSQKLHTYITAIRLLKVSVRTAKERSIGNLYLHHTTGAASATCFRLRRQARLISGRRCDSMNDRWGMSH